MSQIRELPSYDDLHRMFFYNPTTGNLRWKPRVENTRGDKIFNAKYAGKSAGCVAVDRDGGSKCVIVNFSSEPKRRYRAHRIIWKMMTGHEPPNVIDHKDCDETNLGWYNLRVATHSQNRYNQKTRKDSRSGIKGVRWRRGKWTAMTAADGRRFYLGSFATSEEASAAVIAARTRLHGEFARHK